MVRSNKVVACSGYFDPIHVGHLEYLRRACTLGDKLVVILNTDAQAIEKKGYVFMEFEERKRILEAIKYVDFVIECIDKDGTVCETLRQLKPDIFAKGGDRFASEIPEWRVCDMAGIKIVDGLGKKIQSSSDLVDNSKSTQPE
jgi:cytidyltransferase-like protein